LRPTNNLQESKLKLTNKRSRLCGGLARTLYSLIPSSWLYV